jgi:hypothetical protein
MGQKNVADKEDEPIEVSLEGADELEIVVEDDTPLADRGRKPLEKDALAIDDEAEKYSEGVKKRLGELRHQAHDERRRKEEAQRERDEAVNFAKTALQKARELEKKLIYGEASYSGEVAEKAKLAMAAAKDKHSRAFEAGDAIAMAEAVAELAAAAQQEAEAKRWNTVSRQKAENALQQDDDEVDSRISQQKPALRPITPDAQATEWAQKNAWFGNEPDMTALVYGVHERLVKAGVHPVKDAEQYYSTIDAEMRRRFPEYEWQDESDGGKPPKTPSSGKPKITPAVAPVTRTPSSTGKGKVVLTQTQVKMAQKFGLTLEQYAREIVKLEQSGA